jgi:hypothetical protein
MPGGTIRFASANSTTSTSAKVVNILDGGIIVMVDDDD